MSLSLEERRTLFSAGRYRVPWPVRGDAYTVSSRNIVSEEAKAKSVYNFTNRRSPAQAFPGIAHDSRMVLYGLTDFIRNELTTPDTMLDLCLASEFMKTADAFRGNLDFDYKMWKRVIEQHDGFLPIMIEALPEGSTFWPNEPVIQVTSLDRGFGEVAAIVEAMLVGYVSCATARLTLTRHLLERMRELVRKYHPTYTATEVDAIAQWMIHDFGMRASSNSIEAEVYGRAHLLVFNGTDTTSAAFQAWINDARRPIGTSILALAHRIVMGHVDEQAAYEAIFEAAGEGVGSYVADCYDFHSAVRNFLVNIAKRSKGTVVARPDSGDYLENVLFIVDEALKAGLYKPDENGRPAATHLRFIQGDSMNYEKICRVFEALAAKDVDPTGWGIFGVGGWLRNMPNRDTLSSAYKLSAYGESSTPCVKLSDTLAKVSVPGPTIVRRKTEMTKGPTVSLVDEHMRSVFDGYLNAYVTFYNGGTRNSHRFTNECLEDFNTVRNRVLNQFDTYASMPVDYGTCDNLPHSPAVRALQQQQMERYGKSTASYGF